MEAGCCGLRGRAGVAAYRCTVCACTPCLVPFCACKSEQLLDICNGPAFWAQESPSGNVHANARALARVGAAVLGEVDGTRLLSAEALREGLYAGQVAKKMTKKMTGFMSGMEIPAQGDEGTWGNMGLFHFKDDGDGDKNEVGERGDMHGWRGFGGSALTIHAEKQVSIALAVSFYNFLDHSNSMSRRIGNAVLACHAAAGTGAKPMAMERK